MSVYGTFREVAIQMAPKQAEMVNKFLEMTPFISNLPMAPTSNGIQHVFERVADITVPQAVDLDAPLPIVGSNTELDNVDITQFGGRMYVGEDKIQTLKTTAAAYFDSKLRVILPQTAQDLEKALLVNSFLAYADGNSNSQTAGGTNTGNMYSMICTTFVPGSIEGLYNSAGWGRGQVFDAANINNGALMDIPGKSGETILGYGSRIKSQMGVQLADERYVSAINNIDIAIDTSEATGRAALPTEEQMDDMILNARGYSDPRSRIVMPYEVLVAMNAYKGSALEMNVQDDNFDRRIAMWNGVPIIPTYNFGKTA